MIGKSIAHYRVTEMLGEGGINVPAPGKIRLRRE